MITYGGINMRYQTQITVKLKGQGNLQNYVTSLNLNDNIKVADFKTEIKNVFRITIRVVGQGDYLPSYAGNLDIITSAAAYLPKLIHEKNYY